MSLTIIGKRIHLNNRIIIPTIKLLNNFYYNNYSTNSINLNDQKLSDQISPLRSLKNKSNNNNNNLSEFIDYKHVNVIGGKGGDGMICFLQLWCNDKAGPSGGDGGNGGHIIFEASKNVKSLNQVKSKYTGEPGENGMSKDMTGKNAKHTVIPVPIGTLIKDANTGRIVANLHCNEMKFLAAKGGSGGKGNHYFLSNKNRHPYVAEIGANGENNRWILEMKIIADAGLVGFPNAGKSTLLNALTRARPKVACYPFTTLKPSIGIVQYNDRKQLSIADLPGIIADAHQNKGLGLNFLKHIERCVCLFFVIDLSVTDNDPYRQFEILFNEIRHYNEELIMEKQITIIANKIDSINDIDIKLKLFQQKLMENNYSKKIKLIPASGKYGINLKEILIHLKQLCDTLNIYHQDDDD